MASFLRRLEQGLLEQLGATTSSKDASFDADDQRLRRLEDSLARVNATVFAWLASLKRTVEQGRELASVLDFFASSDVKHGVVPRSADSVRFIDAVQAALRVQTGIKVAVLKSIEDLCGARIIAPLGAMLKQVPAIKRMLDARREALTGAYSRPRALVSARSPIALFPPRRRRLRRLHAPAG